MNKLDFDPLSGVKDFQTINSYLVRVRRILACTDDALRAQELQQINSRQQDLITAIQLKVESAKRYTTKVPATIKTIEEWATGYNELLEFFKKGYGSAVKQKLEWALSELQQVQTPPSHPRPANSPVRPNKVSTDTFYNKYLNLFQNNKWLSLILIIGTIIIAIVSFTESILKVKTFFIPKESVESKGVKLVDVYIENSEFDIKLRSNGSEVAFLKKVEIDFKKKWEVFPSDQVDFSVIPTGEVYNFEIQSGQNPPLFLNKMT